MTFRLAFVAGVLTEVRAPGLPSDLAAHGPDAVDAPGCGGVGDPRRKLPGGIDCSLLALLTAHCALLAGHLKRLFGTGCLPDRKNR